MLRHAPHIFGDGHPIVIEHHDQRFAALARIGQPLIGQSTGERAVPDQRDDMVVLLQKGACPRHPRGHRHRIGRMSRDKCVMDALSRLGVA